LTKLHIFTPGKNESENKVRQGNENTHRDQEKVKERRINLFQSVGNGMSLSPFRAKFVQSDSRLQMGTKCYISIGTTKRISQENLRRERDFIVWNTSIICQLYILFLTFIFI